MEGDIQIYTPLDVAVRQIRIARILPSEDCSAVVRCELDIVTLPEIDTTFEALSYCWGDPKITADIELNGAVAAITVNLEAALRQFRADAKGKPVCIWIDAICINQQDVEERNDQVTLMQEIYTRATNVRIWLGIADQMSEKLCRVLRRLINEPTSSNDLESLFAEEHSIEVRMIYLSVLFAYEYWIVQEVRCAQHRTLHIGQYIEDLPLDVFAKLREYIRVQVILALYQAFCVKKDPSIDIGHDGLPESSAIGEAALALGYMLERSHTVLADLNNTQQWHNFLRALKTSECSVEHDSIYAILGLLPNKLGMEIDYKIPIVDLLCEFTWRWIQYHQTLNCFYDVRNVDSNIPSWVPELRHSKLRISALGTRALGPEAISPDTLSAGKFKAHAGANKSQLTRIDHYTVSVGTFLFDTIVAVSPNEGDGTCSGGGSVSTGSSSSGSSGSSGGSSSGGSSGGNSGGSPSSSSTGCDPGEKECGSDYCIDNTAICCSEGKYCDAGQKCTGTGGCIDEDEISCGDGTNCDAGEQCTPSGGCIPAGAVDCGDGTFCRAGRTCSPNSDDCNLTSDPDEETEDDDISTTRTSDSATTRTAQNAASTPTTATRATAVSDRTSTASDTTQTDVEGGAARLLIAGMSFAQLFVRF